MAIQGYVTDFVVFGTNYQTPEERKFGTTCMSAILRTLT